MKTEAEKIEISKQVAEIVGRPANTRDIQDPWLIPLDRWLVDDHGACAEIAADRRMIVDNLSFSDKATIKCFSDNGQYHYIEACYADFPSRIEATSWAICKAVIEQSKEQANG